MIFTSKEEAYKFYNAYPEKLALVSRSATLNIGQLAHYLRSILFAAMKVTRTLVENINQRKSVLQQGHAVFNSMCHEKGFG
jgi:hypothetical protein